MWFRTICDFHSITIKSRIIHSTTWHFKLSSNIWIPFNTLQSALKFGYMVQRGRRHFFLWMIWANIYCEWRGVRVCIVLRHLMWTISRYLLCDVVYQLQGVVIATNHGLCRWVINNDNIYLPDIWAQLAIAHTHTHTHTQNYWTGFCLPMTGYRCTQASLLYVQQLLLYCSGCSSHLFVHLTAFIFLAGRDSRCVSSTTRLPLYKASLSPCFSQLVMVSHVGHSDVFRVDY